MVADPVLDWLLESDPAIRWQALRDLARRPFASEQRRVAGEGWGARLLALQDDDGRWGGGVYTPKWTSTTYTLLLLRDLGLAPRHPQALRACRLLLEEGCWDDGGINFYQPRSQRSETCITAMVLSVCSWFGLKDKRLGDLAAYLRNAQLNDGGWNCSARPGERDKHSSFHTTISVLEALHTIGEPSPRAVEFLLAHRLFRSHRTGAVARAEFTRLHFPPRWHYDVLRGLDYFRAAGCRRDPRLQDAIDLLESHRRRDGKWLLARGYPGKTFFELEAAGKPSRWNTLRALRVLQWWKFPQKS
jgi:hypothetical protein